MEAGRTVLARRLALILVAGLYLTLAALNAAHLPVLVALEEPRRSTRFTMAGLSALFGLFALYLLVRDLKGRALPFASAVRPAWLIVGLSLLDAHQATRRLDYLIVGVAAIAMGLVSLAMMIPSFRMKASK